MITIDEEKGVVTVLDKNGTRTFALGSSEGFAAISAAWLRSGWDTKYVYSFTWMGRPIIQLPEDMMRIQEVVCQIQPDVLIETGVAHGGSLAFYASLFKAMEKGRVIGIDIEIRPHNRQAIEAHPLKPYITLIEGSSIAPETTAQVRALVAPGERVLVMLDSCHTKAHVLAELEAYAPLVSVGSYIVAADGIMGEVAGAPRTQPDWTWNNPSEAAREFVTHHPDFVIEGPAMRFNEGTVRERVTYWPGGFIRRIR